MATALQYDAFISYKHGADKAVAEGVQRVLQTLGAPWWKRRSMRIFRDDTTLVPTHELWASIERALASSRFFILVASPEAASSPWVEKEVAFWLANRDLASLFIAVTGGTLSWNAQAGDFDWGLETPLPRVLEKRFATEPLWVDLRAYRGARGSLGKSDREFVGRVAGIAAAILGRAKDDLLSEELRQQRRNLAWAWSAAGGLALLSASAVWLGLLAEQQRKVAVEQRDTARRTQSALLAQFSTRARQDGDTNRALLLSLEALVGSEAAGRPPYTAPAERSLREALYDHRLRHVLRPPAGFRYSEASMSADGALLAATRKNDSQSAVDLLEIAGQRPVASDLLAGLGSRIVALRFAHEEKRLAAATADGFIHVWDHAARKPLSRVGPFAARSDADSAEYALTGNGRYLIVKADSTVVFDASSGRAVYRIAQKDTQIATARAGQRFIIGFREGDTYLAHTFDGAQTRPLSIWRGQIHDGLSLNRDGSLAAGNTYTAAYLWSTDTGRTVSELPRQENRIFDVRVSDGARYDPARKPGEDKAWPESQYVVTGEEGDSKIWFNRGGAPVQLSLKGFGHFSSWGRNTQFLLRDSNTDQPHLFDLAAIRREGLSPQRLANLGGHEEGSDLDATFSPDGRSVVTVTKAGIIRVWLAQPLLQSLSVEMSDYTLIPALSADGTRLAVVSAETVTVHDVAASSKTAPLSFDLGTRRDLGETGQPVAAAHSSDGTRLAVSIWRAASTSAKIAREREARGFIRFYDIDKRTLLASSAPLGKSFDSLRFIRDGRSLLAEANDGTSLQLSTATGKPEPLEEPTADERATRALIASRLDAFAKLAGEQREKVTTARRGPWLAATVGGHAAAWKLPAPEPVWAFAPGPTSSERYDAIAIIGDHLLAGRAERSVAVVDLANGRIVAELPVESHREIGGIHAAASTAAFAVIGRVTTGWPGPRVSVWRHIASLNELIATAQGMVSSCLTRAERAALELPADPPGWCIEQEKWPYHTTAWKEWLRQRRAGGAPVAPGE